ncbi:MAG: hypothetical protein WBD63_00890 [Phycisphaerae bacterium]
MAKVDLDYISSAIEDLVAALGIRDHVDYAALTMMLLPDSVGKCVEAVAGQMGLPVRVNLSYVPAGWQPPGSGGSGNAFESSSLAHTTATGRGAEGITAQVCCPASLPLYGSSKLNGMVIQVKVTENCVAHPQTFVAIIAHELCHILLRSLAHPQSDNEIYTDLAAMVLGFSNVIHEGRKLVSQTHRGNWVETQTTTFGYLDDEQFDFALSRVDALLTDCRGLKNKVMALSERLLGDCQEGGRMSARFGEALAYLDSHQERRIKKHDAVLLVGFHRPGYTEPTEAALRECRQVAEEASRAVRTISSYTQGVVASLRRSLERLTSSSEELAAHLVRLRADCKVVERNIGFLARLRLRKERKKREASSRKGSPQH